ncbi:unnamed protein product [Cylindrotheca closterium]|uniref:Uncharacterized protein n=1 Tax=Cylindrotheca closterium TaxID=2856 RepID=A0AAD2PW54_9STRA|nr:unnamed protein product [Cylindrotheca closterium]
MKRTRNQSSSLLFVKPLPCLFYLMMMLLNVKLSLTDPQRDLQHYSNYKYDASNLNNNAGYFDDSSSTNGGDGLFMVGNSYTAMNNLTEIVVNMLEHSSRTSSSGVRLPLQTETWSLDGAKWKHYAYRLSSQDHLQPPETFQDALKRKEFRWVVLQEQSQIPGLFQSDVFQNEWIDSRTAVKIMDEQIQQFGNSNNSTQTILFETWGRLRRDDSSSQLAELFSNYQIHQSRIVSGYKEYQKLLSTPARPVMIAPVGHAFQAIHDSMVKEGVAPEQDGGRFANLYGADGSHPSAQGSYLAASVLVGILTGQDPRGFDWKYPLVPQDTQKTLREVAHATIAIYCQSEYCNPPSVGTSKSSPSSFARNLVRFLLVAGVFLVCKKYNDARNRNYGYSSLPQDRGRSGMHYEMT